MRVAARGAELPVAVYEAASAEPAVSGPGADVANPGADASLRFDWPRAAVAIYVLVAGALLLRLCFGLTMSMRLLHSSHATGQATEGIEIRESDGVASPASLGIARPAIVLPVDWRQWDAARLDAVLAHERSHIRRRDPAVQLLSAIHRALLWHSPLSWFLHRRIVRVAEDASDDAAVAATRDRVSYAEALLEFMQRGVRGEGSQGVTMARYGRPEERIHRILNQTVFARGATRWSVAAILALGVPLAYLVAAGLAGRKSLRSRPHFAVNFAQPRAGMSCRISFIQANSACFARCSCALYPIPQECPRAAVSDILSAPAASVTLFWTAPAGA
jgi:hypothetical protein